MSGRKRQQINAIKAGRTAVGTAGAPGLDIGLLADAGFDFLLFDTQDSAWEIKQMQPLIQAMRGKQTAPVVHVAARARHAWFLYATA